MTVSQLSETLLALLAAFGAVCLMWLLCGRLLSPAGVLLLPVSGDADALEEELRGVVWLRSGGLARLRVVVADCGLTPAGLAHARAVAGLYGNVVLCKPSQLPRLILHKEGSS